jgi:hypothetical protein
MAKKFTFHGAFVKKANALARKKRVGGFIRKVTVKGHTRYAVIKKGK